VARDWPGEISRVLEPVAAFDLDVVLGNQGGIVDIRTIIGMKARKKEKD
jgi:hypothetical protein